MDISLFAQKRKLYIQLGDIYFFFFAIMETPTYGFNKPQLNLSKLFVFYHFFFKP